MPARRLFRTLASLFCLSASILHAQHQNSQLTPPALAFPTVSAGSTSSAQTVILNNYGTTAVPFSAFQVTGPFTADSSSCGQSSIASGAQCYVLVKASPTTTTVGPFTGTLTLVTNAGTDTVALSGTTLPDGSTTTTIGSTSSTGGAVTLTGTVTSTRGTGSPTGNVSFVDTSNSNLALGSVASQPKSYSVSSLWTYSPPRVGDGPGAIANGDFNGDGKLDIVVANSGYPGCGSSCPNSLSVLMGNGDGTFTVSTISNVTGATAVAVADFNGDKKLDIAALDGTDSTVILLIGKGDGTFTKQAATTATGQYPSLILTGDFNKDGKADLAISANANTLTILLGKGDGTFTSQTSPTLDSTYPTALATGDFNGDGNLDMAVGNNGDYNLSSPGLIDILLGDGKGGFTKGTSISSPGTGSFNSFFSIAVGDLNGDGKADLATLVTSTDPNQNVALSILTLLGKGDGTFTAQTPIATTDSDYEASIGIADFSGDGVPDLALANDTHFSLYFGSGTGFSAPLSVSGAVTDPSFLTQTIADFNGDGLPDLAVADGDLNVVRLTLPTRTVTAAASLTVTVPGSGSHNVTASYAGDTNFTASTSSSTAVAASLVTTGLTVKSSASTAVFGTQIVLTATLAPYTTLGLTTDRQPIVFYNGTTALGNGTLSSGVASLNITSLPVGANSITAKYASDNVFAAATSAAVPVTITAAVPVVSLSASSLTFTTQAQGTTSPVQTVTVSNTGTAALSITSLTASGDFAQTNTCGSSVAANSSCTINVTFTPTTTGSRTGTITLTDSASGSPHTVALTGTASGVSVTPSATSLNIANPGGSTTATLTFAGVNGFAGTTTLSCAVTFTGTGTASNPPVCTLSPTSVTVPTTGSATSTLTINTAAVVSSNTPLELFGKTGGATLAVLLCAGLLPRRRRVIRLLLPLIGFVVLGAAMGCSGGGGGSSTAVKSTGTTLGSYQVVVTATSGSTVSNTTLTLNVQ